MSKKALLLFALITLNACTSPPTPTPDVQPPTAVDTASFSPTLPPGASIPDAEALSLMKALTESSSTEQAITRIATAHDTRFIPVFIELMRAAQISLIDSTPYSEYIDALEKLSGQSFGGDWPSWIEWYGKTDLTPPPGFTGWKGQLLAGIDSRFADFLRDDAPSRIRVEEVQWGGVRVDGIPALDNAAMIPAAEASYLTPDEPVFGLSINGDSRAYPLRILDWHEMANDVVGGVPVSLAYCTLCGAGIAYDGRASDGNTYTFGSSGFLFRSNKLMYDRQTRTLWNQLTGEPVLGELADTDVKLSLLPVVLTSWADWQKQHPDTVVLDVNTGYDRPYTPGAAYGDYFSAADTMFPVWQRNELLPAKARVYALRINGVPKAYPVEALTAEKVVNDSLGGTSVVLVAARGAVIVEGTNRRVGPVTYDAGGEVRAFDRGSQTFSPGPDADTVIDADGRTWMVTEEALIGPNGEKAPRLNGHLAYWFGWFAFFPNTLVYGQP